MNPKIESLKIEKIVVDTSNSSNNSDKELQKLLPTFERERISFYLKNANLSIANAIRRVVSGELKVKYLTCNIHDISTNDDYIILDELRDRINFIPLKQDVPINTTFTLNASNIDSKKRYKIVHSNEIISKTYIDKAFAETFRIAELSPTKYLIIPKITVVEDYGFNYSASCLTLDIEYHLVDYIPVKFINERANIITKRVKTDDLMKIINELKIKANRDELFNKKILVIPNKSYQKQMSAKQIEDIKKFDLIVENPNTYEINSLTADDQFLKGYQNAEYDPKEFYLAITTYGNIDASKILNMVHSNLIERLENIKKAIIAQQSKSENDEKVEKDPFIDIIQDNIKTQIIIRGEDHTIGNLLAQTCYELDPQVGLINTPQQHPLNRTIVLNIIHSQSLKLILDAIDELKKRLNVLIL